MKLSTVSTVRGLKNGGDYSKLPPLPYSCTQLQKNQQYSKRSSDVRRPFPEVLRVAVWVTKLPLRDRRASETVLGGRWGAACPPAHSGTRSWGAAGVFAAGVFAFANPSDLAVSSREKEI